MLRKGNFDYMDGFSYEMLIRRAFNYPQGHRQIGYWENDTDKVRVKIEKALDKLIQKKDYISVVKELMLLKKSVSSTYDRNGLMRIISKTLVLTRFNKEG